MTATGTRPTPQRLATPSEVAEWLGTDEEHLSKLRRRGDGPAFIKVGRKVRYAWADVHKWADAQRTTRTRASDG
jgi:predicted DNA-binding transcriptional regulator AlpA